MTRRRWIADEVSAGRAAVTGDNASHLVRVLRARLGQEFDVAADGRLCRGRIVGIRDDRVEFELGEELPAALLPALTLWLAVFKFDRMEWAVEKATELGVARIVPLLARRSEPHLAKSAQKRVERWRRIAREAAQQSRRLAAPEIAVPVQLKNALATATGRCIVLSEAAEGSTLKDALAGASGEVTLAIGPEGGWTEEELQHFAAAAWTSASLGQTILRTETATIAAVAIVMSELLS